MLLLGLMIRQALVKKTYQFRAGEDSLKFNVVITDDERRGEAPLAKPMEVKKKCAELLEKLRKDGIGLKPKTEYNIESYFIVADAFEADGLLVQAVDYLADLQRQLEALIDTRAGKKHPHSLIETEDDILQFRDAHNLHVFDGKYMAGAQPTEKGYRWLKSKGVTTIINLRLPSEHEKKIMEDLGMEYIHIPWADERAPTIKQVKQMLDAVRNAKGKVMQHCLRGIGRDMTMASSYMIANHGKSAEFLIKNGREQAPRWESDQKRDKESGEPIQFKLLREFEKTWKASSFK
jgi:protein tyrosine phosphatase (PTP) superfamily phosphohydrolase (DUF442 family)